MTSRRRRHCRWRSARRSWRPCREGAHTVLAFGMCRTSRSRRRSSARTPRCSGGGGGGGARSRRLHRPGASRPRSSSCEAANGGARARRRRRSTAGTTSARVAGAARARNRYERARRRQPRQRAGDQARVPQGTVALHPDKNQTPGAEDAQERGRGAPRRAAGSTRSAAPLRPPARQQPLQRPRPRPAACGGRRRCSSQRRRTSSAYAAAAAAAAQPQSHAARVARARRRAAAAASHAAAAGASPAAAAADRRRADGVAAGSADSKTMYNVNCKCGVALTAVMLPNYALRGGQPRFHP